MASKNAFYSIHLVYGKNMILAVLLKLRAQQRGLYEFVQQRFSEFDNMVIPKVPS